MVEKILQLAAHITYKNHIPRAPNCSVPPISLSILQSPRPQIHSVAIAAHRVHRSRSVVHRRRRIKLVFFFYFPRKHLFILFFSLSQSTNIGIAFVAFYHAGASFLSLPLLWATNPQSQFSMMRTDQMSMIWFQFLEAFFHDLIPTYGVPLWVWFYFMQVFLAVNLEAQFLDDAG